VLESERSEVVGAGKGLEPGYSAGRWEACLDATKVGPALWVRRRRNGDRFVPLGMERPKKLQDFLVDEKVPRADRDRIPVVATPDRIVWVVGYRIDDRFKVTADTREVLRLRYRRAEAEV
jgi:tRNA(Ile)-lysidine synthase